MKKVLLILTFVLVVTFTTTCGGMSISEKQYNQISNYVLENENIIAHKDDIEFFDYDTAGLCVGGVYYGYYYTSDNEIVVPDFYSGEDLGEPYEADDGVYFGKPNNGTAWCFIKQITDNWYYYELHWG